MNNLRVLILSGVIFFIGASSALASAVPVPSGALLVDANTGALLFGRNDEQKFSIASITKLMTALVFLDHNPGMAKRFTYRKADDAAPAKLVIRFGETVRVKDLWYAALVGSRNNAARALAHATGLSEKRFVAEMNAKAQRLGMTKTIFVETTGLSPKNRSVGRDIAMLARAAFARKEIRKALRTKQYVVRTLNTKRRLTIKNTNAFIRSGDPLVAEGKTGYIDESGYNFVGRGRSGDVIALVFGAASRQKVFDYAKDLVSSYGRGITASSAYSPARP